MISTVQFDACQVVKGGLVCLGAFLLTKLSKATNAGKANRKMNREPWTTMNLLEVSILRTEEPNCFHHLRVSTQKQKRPPPNNSRG